MAFADDGFYHALQQDPDNDLIRLAYADSSEERGGDSDAARAEFIRVQIRLASPAASGQRGAELAAALAAREAELLAEWDHEWLGGWAGTLTGWRFRRGFVEAVEADASAFLERAAELFADWPTLTVAKLNRAAGHLPELAASPWLAHLRGLDLSDNGIADDGLTYLTASRFVCLLRGLDLSGNPVGPGGASLLANSRSADELSELHLAGCRLGREGVERLLGGPRTRQWRRLDLSGNDLRPRDLVNLAVSAAMPGLMSLDLSSNLLGEAGVSPLADSPAAAGLIDLGLCDTRTGDEGVAALARSPHLVNLRGLDLRGHACSYRTDRWGQDHGGIGDLCRSPLLARLRRLLLGRGDGCNGWAADVLAAVRPARRRTTERDWWVCAALRKSCYLMPSQLEECDLDEVWWLGDTGRRERLPKPAVLD